MSIDLSIILEQRNNEIQEYQLNINNFIRAIKKIETTYSNNQDMLEFKEQLQKLLADNQREQLKSIIMRDVIADQLAELEES
jgi:carbonic anhydrase